MSNAVVTNRSAVGRPPGPGTPVIYGPPGSPIQTRPTQAISAQAISAQARPVQARPVQARPVQARPVQARPAQARPAQARPQPPPGTRIVPGPKPGTVTIYEPGKPPVVVKAPIAPQGVRTPQGLPPQVNQTKPKKKKSWSKLIIIIIIIVAIIVGIFLLLYFFVFTGSDNGGDNGGGDNGGGGTIPKPPANAPYQGYPGSAGNCSVDTDCNIITTKGVLYTQYCVNPNGGDTGTSSDKKGICVTNKVCEKSSDCLSIPGLDELPTCDLANGQPCNFTAGCVSGFCQRLRCQNSTECGYFEACTINTPGSNEFGYCVPLGNECISTSTTNSATAGSFDCWAGAFGCTAPIIQTQASSTGYCTECIIGETNSCNMSNNPKSGPGSACKKMDIDTISGAIAPGTCILIDDFKYTTCPDPISHVSGGDINGLTACCDSGQTNNMCGKRCYDDYMCDDSCPFCVEKIGVGAVCSCLRATPYQRSFDSVQSTYACINSNGVTMIDLSAVTSADAYVVPNSHACTVSPGGNAKCIYNYFATFTNGDMNCQASSPYCNVTTNTCSTIPIDSRCNLDKDNGYKCQTFSNGIWTDNGDYVCGVGHLCREGRLQAGENCWGQETQCDTGLVCSKWLTNPDAPSSDGTYINKICVPNGQGS